MIGDRAQPSKADLHGQKYLVSASLATFTHSAPPLLRCTCMAMRRDILNTDNNRFSRCSGTVKLQAPCRICLVRENHA
jgi:hypothetical protein